MLDVGTNRQELLDDPLYLGARHPGWRGEQYDAFIDRYVAVASRLFPHALLHWEDFGTSNARRILQRFRSSPCTFNDDMQGTGAVNLAAVLSASAVGGGPPDGGAPGRGVRLRHGRASASPTSCATRWHGAGLALDEATRRFWCVGRHGLLADDRADRARLPGAVRPTGRTRWRHPTETRNESGAGSGRPAGPTWRPWCGRSGRRS